MQFSKPILLVGLAGSAFAAPSLVTRAEYGSVVDTVESVPDANEPPATLANRNDNAEPNFTVTGNYEPACDGCLGGDYILFWNGGTITMSGSGYFWVRYEIAYFNTIGPIVPPTWTGLSGKLFHVASGMGHRMDDPSGSDDGTNCTWMGCDNGRDTLPDGMQQMWGDEFFYLDGTVTLNDNEGYADYNLAIKELLWEQVNDDINTPPGDGIIRYGIARDTTGDDSAPVPQYLTCDTPSDMSTVAQQSDVGSCYDS